MLPVGQFAAVRDVASAVKSAREIGYPVVLKPNDSGRGNSVYVDLRDENELRAALQPRASASGPSCCRVSFTVRTTAC